MSRVLFDQGEASAASTASSTTLRLPRRAGIAIVLLALVALFVAVLSGASNVTAVARLERGSAWLSSADGAVLVNGASGLIEGSASFACGQSILDCAFVEQDDRVYVMNQTDGMARILERAEQTISDPIRVGGPQTLLLAAGGRVHSVDTGTGDVRELDPATLQERSKVNFGSKITDAVAESTGRVILTTQGSGNVTGVTGTETVTINIGKTRDSIVLGTRSGSVVIVNQSAHELGVLELGGTNLDRVSLPSELRYPVPGRELPSGPVWVIDQKSGLVVRSDLDQRSSEIIATIPGNGSFGAPIALGHRLFLLQRVGVKLHVLDLERRAEEEPIAVARTLTVKPDFLYVDDPRGKGTIVDVDGQRRAIVKAEKLVATDDEPTEEVTGPTPESAPTTTTRAAKKPAVKPKARPKARRRPATRPKPRPRPKAKAKAKPKPKPRPTTTPKPTTTRPAPSSTTTTPGVGPQAASGVRATLLGPGDVEVTWVAADPTIVDLAIVPDGGKGDIEARRQVVPAGTSSVRFLGLPAGTTYRFRVIATDSQGRTAVSDHSNPVTLASTPGAMGTITVTTVPANGLGATSAKLQWQAVADNGSPVTYHIKDDTGTEVGATTSLEWNISTILPGTVEIFTVEPRNGTGTGPSGQAEVVSYLDLDDGPIAGVVSLERTVDVTYTQEGNEYTFGYTITNRGKAVCIPRPGVSIERSAPPTDHSVVSPMLCLKPGARVNVTPPPVTLERGSYDYAAVWTDGTGKQQGYGNGVIEHHTLLVP